MITNNNPPELLAYIGNPKTGDQNTNSQFSISVDGDNENARELNGVGVLSSTDIQH